MEIIYYSENEEIFTVSRLLSEQVGQRTDLYRAVLELVYVR